MELSQKNATALLFNLNQDIEEYAEFAVKNIIDERKYDGLNYPPNCGFTDLEKTELDKLDNNEYLKNALRKIIADNSAGVVFDLLNILDGTASPKRDYKDCSGVLLVDEIPDNDAEPLQYTLHDGFFETYWDWKKARGEKNWTLDTYEDNH